MENDKFTIQIGDVLVLQNKNPLSWLIRIFTRSDYSHTEVFIGEKYTVGSAIAGVRKVEFDPGDKKYAVMRHKKLLNGLSQEDKDYLLNRINSKIGTKYDFKFTFLYQPSKQFTYRWLKVNPDKFRKTKFYKKIIKPIKRLLDVGTFLADDKFACSEYTGWVLKLKRWDTLSPQDVFEHQELVKMFVV
ncbi:MAG: hypothetical protein JXR51_15000 [Bacteroidales bacterium]|nr:hypothetical protein [Bacteroidales bacterium]MBN2758479.1 hypothetical protein [Bacteroidales bacterium]